MVATQRLQTKVRTTGKGSSAEAETTTRTARSYAKAVRGKARNGRSYERGIKKERRGDKGGT